MPTVAVFNQAQTRWMRQTYQKSFSATASAGSSTSDVLTAVGSINPAVTSGFSDSTSLKTSGSFSPSVTGGFAASTKRITSGTFSASLTSGFNDAGKLSIAGSLLLPVSDGFSDSVSTKIPSSLSLSVFGTASLLSVMTAKGSWTGAVTSGFQDSSKLRTAGVVAVSASGGFSSSGKSHIPSSFTANVGSGFVTSNHQTLSGITVLSATGTISESNKATLKTSTVLTTTVAGFWSTPIHVSLTVGSVESISSTSFNTSPPVGSLNTLGVLPSTNLIDIVGNPNFSVEWRILAAQALVVLLHPLSTFFPMGVKLPSQIQAEVNLRKSEDPIFAQFISSIEGF